MKGKVFWAGLLAGTSLVLLFQYSLLTHLSTPVGLLHGDSFLVYTILKHWMRAVFSGEWTSATTLPMFYGFANSLFFTDMHIVQAIMAMPIYAFTRDIIVTSHIVVILTVISSFASMYVLVWYLTEHAVACVLSGIIYVLNPFVFARYPDQINIFSLQFFPLIILTFERVLTGKRGPNAFLFFFFLACQMLTSLYYSIQLTVILPLYAAARLWQEQRIPRGLFRPSGVAGALLFFVVGTVMAQAYSAAYREHPISRSLGMSQTYAARPTDWLFTSEFNVLYGGLKATAAQAYPSLVRMGIYSEHNLFPGVTVLILFFLTLFSRYEGITRPRIFLWGGLVLFSWLLSLGPHITWSDSASTPGIYGFVYRINPLMQYMRVPARFGMVVFFFAALIIGQYIASATRAWPLRKTAVMGVLLTALVLGEYWNKPLEFAEISSQVRSAYEQVQKRADWKVILEYPIGNLISYDYPQARSEDMDARYLLYATTLHDKTLFNGYSGFLPPAYYERANYLSVNFPTPAKLIRAREWGVDAIVLHESEFPDRQSYKGMIANFDRYGAPKVFSGDEITIYDLTAFSGK